MRIRQHADNTEIHCGYRAEDIHAWIDQFFDLKMYRLSSRRRLLTGWNPYEHRHHLHHREALPEALDAFKEKYSEDVIECVFLQHLRDDYRGYIPCKSDFDDESFRRKYHRLF